MSDHSNKPGKQSLGASVFRWRSYSPLLAILGLALGLGRGLALPLPGVGWLVAAGLVLAAVGLALRAYAVGLSPAGTSGRHREQHAALLNTFGVYSVMRHPLYVGNVLIWSGVSVASGWPLGAAVSTVVGAVVFGIIALEEDVFLAGRFGSEFAEWSAATPRFWPRFALWRTARRPLLLSKAVRSEYSTLHSIGLLTLIFWRLRSGAEATFEASSSWWWLLLAANSAVYCGIRLWRHRYRR